MSSAMRLYQESQNEVSILGFQRVQGLNPIVVNPIFSSYPNKRIIAVKGNSVIFGQSNLPYRYDRTMPEVGTKVETFYSVDSNFETLTVEGEVFMTVSDNGFIAKFEGLDEKILGTPVTIKNSIRLLGIITNPIAGNYYVKMLDRKELV